MKIRCNKCQNRFSIQAKNACKKHICPNCGDKAIPRDPTHMNINLGDMSKDTRRGFNATFWEPTYHERKPKKNKLSWWNKFKKWIKA